MNAAAQTIAVSIIDDDSSFRNKLEWVLNNSDGYQCVGSYSGCSDALKKIEEYPPDVMLMDIGMPDVSGIECVEKLTYHFPNIRVLMLTVYSDDEKIFQSLQAGAVGYLLKKTPPEKLLEYVHDAYAGGVPMSGEVARKVLGYFRQPKLEQRSAELSDREVEVLEALVEGYTYKAIAERLFISVNTVGFHLRNIYAKLHVKSRSEAIAFALKHKLL
ncbi:MAG: response regulator transcription factor [Bacteroidota bacterium]|nr:response regulator transcription factor [Bacteroidota bacterium]